MKFHVKMGAEHITLFLEYLKQLHVIMVYLEQSQATCKTL